MRTTSNARMHCRFIGVVLGLCGLLWAGVAAAAPGRDIEHVVAPGQNLGMIAKRYHTTAEAIRAHNRLKEKHVLRVGQKLRVPESADHRRWLDYLEKKNAPKEPPKRAEPKRAAKRAEPKRAEAAQPAKPEPPKNPWARKGHRPGRVAIVRHEEKFVGQLVSSDGKLVGSATDKLDVLLRSRRTGARTTMDRRLLSLLAEVSDHFGGRSIIVISGFRPHSKHQYTRNSRHNHGKAIDFRVVGVPNEELYAFCRTLPSVGCGYYPNSTFVHMDVRNHKTQWTDYSKPGEPPIYARDKRSKRDVPKPAPRKRAPKKTSRARGKRTSS